MTLAGLGLVLLIMFQKHMAHGSGATRRQLRQLRQVRQVRGTLLHNVVNIKEGRTPSSVWARGFKSFRFLCSCDTEEIPWTSVHPDLHHVWGVRRMAVLQRGEREEQGVSLLAMRSSPGMQCVHGCKLTHISPRGKNVNSSEVSWRHM